MRRFPQDCALLFPVFLLMLFFSSPALGQEFNCDVILDTRQINDSSYDYIDQLEQQIEQYVNENRWTDDIYEPFEKLTCRMQIILRSVDEQSRFNAEVVFNLNRPIYDTMRQTSTVILIDDSWQFSYTQNSNLVFDQIQFDSLTGFIDFYMYVLLGFDYDSFSELGGSPHFARALEILEMGLQSGTTGWNRGIGNQRNRNGLISDIMNPSYETVRVSNYRYHRLGLDQFVSNPEEARYQILDTLNQLQEAKRMSSRSYLFDLFFDTKYQELTSIFIDAGIQTRQQAYNLLTEADPAHSGVYSRLQ